MSKHQQSSSFGMTIIYALLHVLAWVFSTTFTIIAIIFAWTCKLLGTILQTIGEKTEHSIHK